MYTFIDAPPCGATNEPFGGERLFILSNIELDLLILSNRI